MKISDLAIKKPVTMIMAMLIVLVLGITSFTGLQLDLMPEINMPMAGVMTIYPGASPTEVEKLVTKPLEEELGTVSNLENISSISKENMSLVVFKFSWETDIDQATLELRDKLEFANQKLPEEIQAPIVMKFNPSMLPTMEVAVSADMDQEELTNLVNDKVVDRLKRTDGIAMVDVTGGAESEIKITVDQDKLAAMDLSLNDISDLLKAQKLSLPAGAIIEDEKTINVRATSELNTVEDIENIVLGPITLKDIASVEQQTKEMDSIVRVNDETALKLVIRKQGSANTVKASNDIKAELEEIEKDIAGLEFTVVMDQAEIINKAVTNVSYAGLLGALIAAFVIYFFLRNIRTTLIISIAIPFSIIATFTLLYFGDLTLNMMTLGGLVLGIGMLVDNSIVVLESIYRQMERKGKNAYEAARIGAGEVAGAIIASTLTTLAVFIPVLFITGIAGQMFKELALTITYSLVASLAVALTVVPVMASKILKIRSKTQLSELSDKEKKARQGLFHKIYKKILTWSLKHKAITVIVTLVLFVGSLALGSAVGTELMPNMDRGEASVSIEMPYGTSLAETEEVTKKVEEKILSYNKVDITAATIGSGELLDSLVNEVGPHTAEVYIKLVPRSERDITTNEFIDKIKNTIVNIDDRANINILRGDTEMMSMMGKIEYEIKGDNLDKLKKASEDLIAEMEEVEGATNVSSNLIEGNSELDIKINKEKALAKGLIPAQAIASIRLSMTGLDVLEINPNDEKINVKLDLEESQINSREALENLKINNNVLLKDIADIEEVTGPTNITRENQFRSIAVTADVESRDVGTINSEINEKIKEMEIPEGVEINRGGVGQLMNDAFDNLGWALIIAVVLIYMVMAAQFESLIHPFVIIFTIPLAIIGVVVALFVTSLPISMTAIVGVIVLAGIVVNNAIVLVTSINQLREQGLEKEKALVKAGLMRLRPIFMTALTTILALIPMALAIGEGTEVMQPMALTVIGGLLIATLLTLVVIPVIYSLLDRKKVSE